MSVALYVSILGAYALVGYAAMLVVTYIDGPLDETAWVVMLLWPLWLVLAVGHSLFCWVPRRVAEAGKRRAQR